MNSAVQPCIYCVCIYEKSSAGFDLVNLFNWGELRKYGKKESSNQHQCQRKGVDIHLFSKC